MWLVMVSTTHAQVVISEVMYDLAEGSDTGREWVEVFNAGGSSILLTEWKFFEGNVNHSIAEFQGGGTLSSGGYAVIADNPAKFLIDNPGYTGVIFDSAFSLSNVGESLSLRNPDLVDQDSLTYDATVGGAGDGKTLQRTTPTSVLVPQLPTPGTGSLVATQAPSDTPAPQSTPAVQDTSATSSPGGIFYYAEPQIFAYAGKDRYALVGADIIFEAKALSKDGTLLEGPGVSYVWNFGDGATSDTQTVSHHFTYPGTYAVVLDVASGKYAGSHRIFVTVEPAQLELVRLDDGGVQISSASPRDIDVSFWHLQVGDVFFTLPKHTVVLARGVLRLRNDVMKLPKGEAVLLYPNGASVDLSPADTQKEASKEPTFMPLKQSEGSRVVEMVPLSPRAEPPPEEVGSEPVEDVTDSTTTETTAAQGQVAAVGAATPGSFVPWVIGLLGIVGIAVLGMMMALAPDNAQASSPLSDEDEEGDDLQGWTISEVNRT